MEPKHLLKQSGKKPIASTDNPWTPWGKWARARQQRRSEREKARSERRQIRQLRRLRRKGYFQRALVFSGLLLSTCLVGTLVMIMIGRPYPWETFADVRRASEISHQLDANQARWESLSIRDYTIQVEYSHGNQRCGPSTIVVREGRVAVEESKRHWGISDRCKELFDTIGVDDSFTWLDTLLAGFEPGSERIGASFSSEFGYITSIEVRAYDVPRSVCCWRINWSNLSPLME